MKLTRMFTKVKGSFPLFIFIMFILFLVGECDTTVKLSNHQRKPRFLCMHGHRSNGDKLKKQIEKWPESVLQKLDLVFVNATFSIQGKATVEGVSDPPLYEWFQANEDLTVYRNFEQCLDYVEDCMLKLGPFDGLLGFSQGALLAGALPGLQAQGMALKKVPGIKFVIVISGGKILDKAWGDKAYTSPVQCPSIHFFGETDIARPNAAELLKCYIDPFVVYHSGGHTVPQLDEKSLPVMLSFLDKIQKIVEEDKQTDPK